MNERQLTFGSLFAGIGGMDLGLEAAGMECSWQCEIDEFARKVLAKNHPKARRHDDVRTFPPTDASEWRVDVLAGGFPCQDISNAGTKAGIEFGERSGLWSEFSRIIRLLRPSYVIVENVAALLDRGIGIVLGDLAGSGFDATWEVLSACAFGAPHMRRRLFIVAYANGLDGRPRVRNPITQQDGSLQAIDGSPRARASWQARLANPSELYGGADGVPFGRNRNRGIGNAVAPRVAEYLGRRIIEAIQEVN
jgi:DNA (cytosine-5)-methyltransferase 1